MNLTKPTLRVIIFFHISIVSLSFGAEISMHKKTTSDDAQSLKKSLTLGNAQALSTNTLSLRKKQEIEKFNDSLSQLHHGIKLFDAKQEEEALPFFLSSLNKIEDNNLSIAPKLEADIKHAIFCSRFALQKKPLQQYLQNNPLCFPVDKDNAQILMGFSMIGQAYAASESKEITTEDLHLKNALDVFNCNATVSIDCITKELKDRKPLCAASTLYKQKQLAKILEQLAMNGNMDAQCALASVYIKKEHNQYFSPNLMLECGIKYLSEFAKISPSNIPHEHPLMVKALYQIGNTDNTARIIGTYLELLHAYKKNYIHTAKDLATKLSLNKTGLFITQLFLHTIPAPILQTIDRYTLTDENLIEFFDADFSLLIGLLEQKLASYENCNAETDAFNRILGLYEFHHENFEKARQHFSQCTNYATDSYLQALGLKISTNIHNFLNLFEYIVSLLQKSDHNQAHKQTKKIVLAAVESFRKKYMATLSPAHTYQMVFCMEQLPEMQRAAYDELIAIEDIVAQETQKNYETLLCNPYRIKLYNKLEVAAQKEHSSLTCKTLTKLKRIQTNSPWINEKNEMELNKQLINCVSCVLKHSDVHERDKSALKAYPQRCIADYMQNGQYKEAYHMLIHLAQTAEMSHIAWQQLPIIETMLTQENEQEYKKIARFEDRTQIHKMLESFAQKNGNLDAYKTLIELNRMHTDCLWLHDKDTISLQENLIKHGSSLLKRTDLPETEKDSLRAQYTQCAATHMQNHRYSPAYHMIGCMAQLPEMQSTAFTQLIALENLLMQEPAKIYEQLSCNAYRMQTYKTIEDALQNKSQSLPLKDLIELQYKHIEKTPHEQSKITLQEKILRYTSYALKSSTVSQEDINTIKECYKNYMTQNIATHQYNRAYHMIFDMMQEPQMQQSAFECFQNLESKPFEGFEISEIEKNSYRTQILETLQRLYQQHNHPSCICKTKTTLNALEISHAKQPALLNLKKTRLEYLSCQRKHADVSERDKWNLQLQHKKIAEEIAHAEVSADNYLEAIKYDEIVIADATNLLKNTAFLEEYKLQLEEVIAQSTERIGNCALAIGIDLQNQERNAQAIKWFDKAIQYENSSALHAKAMYLRNNSGANKKTQEIINLLLQHTKTNDAKNLKALSHDALGVYYFKSNDPINTFIHLKQAADLGCFSSTHALIQLLFDGIPGFLNPSNSLAMHYMNQTIAAGSNIDHLRLIISRAFDLYQKNLHQEALEDITTILLSDKSTPSEKADASWLNGMIEVHKNETITHDIVNHFRKADLFLKENASTEQKSIANLLSVTTEQDIIALCKKIESMINLNRCDEDAFDFYFIVGKLLWEYADHNPTATAYKKIATQGLVCAAEHNHIGSQLWLVNAQDHEISLCDRIYYLENSSQIQPKIAQTLQPILNKIYPRNVLTQAMILRGLLQKSTACTITFLTKLYRVCLPAIEDAHMNQDEIDELIEAFLQKNIILDAAQWFRANPSTKNYFECFSASLLGNLLIWSTDPKLLIQSASYLLPMIQNKKDLRLELANEIAVNLGVIYFKLGLYYLSPTTYNIILAIDFFKRATPFNNPGAMASLSELWLNKIPEAQSIDKKTIYSWITTAHNALNSEDTLELKQRYEKEYGCPNIKNLQKKKK